MTEETEGEAALDKSTRASPTWRNTFARRVRDWASRRFPNYIESSFTKDFRDYHRTRDKVEIAKSIPAERGGVSLKAIFAAEFYTPAHADRLMLAFRRMGWDSEQNSAFNQNNADWVARSRREGYGGWINLGGIVRPEDSKSYLRAATAKLPRGFDRAHAELFSISSSLSCIVVKFVSSSETEAGYEAIAHQQLTTELRKIKRGHTIVSPRSRKKEIVSTTRDSFRSGILEWFTTNLPGVFSTSGNLERFPTCELLFTNNVLSRSPDKLEERNLWAEYLGLDCGWPKLWSSVNIPGLTFSHPLSHLAERKGHAALSIERSALHALENSLYGGDTDEAYLNMLSMQLPALICHWSINGLLKHYQDELNTVRDSGLISHHAGETTELLKQLQRVTSNSVDISLLATEIPIALSRPIRESGDFYFVYEEGEEPISLLENLTHGAIQTIEQLAKSEKIVRDLLVQQGNIVNSLETIATQRGMSKLTTAMTWLTVLIFLLTAGMAYVAFFPTVSSREDTTFNPHQ